jgi:hypothetical protein
MMTRGKPFEPGNKFGRGRPPGSRNRRNMRGQQLLDECGEVLIRKAIAEAIKGDIQMLRTFLSYLLRHPTDRAVEIGPVPMGNMEELSKSSEKIWKKVASGKLSLSEARQVDAMIEERRRVLETQELERRVQALEGVPGPEDLT